MKIGYRMTDFFFEIPAILSFELRNSAENVQKNIIRYVFFCIFPLLSS